MTTIRIHSFEGSNDGTTSCDFRGAAFIGDKEGDHHQTLFEKDVEDTDPLVDLVLTEGPGLNKMLGSVTAQASPVLAALGLHAGLRLGVWDKTAPKD